MIEKNEFIEKAEELNDELDSVFYVLDGMDSCAIGLNCNHKLVYSLSKLIEYRMKIYDEDMHVSLEYIYYNIVPLEQTKKMQILYDLT